MVKSTSLSQLRHFQLDYKSPTFLISWEKDADSSEVKNIKIRKIWIQFSLKQKCSLQKISTHQRPVSRRNPASWSWIISELTRKSGSILKWLKIMKTEGNWQKNLKVSVWWQKNQFNQLIVLFLFSNFRDQAFLWHSQVLPKTRLRARVPTPRCKGVARGKQSQHGVERVRRQTTTNRKAEARIQRA